MMRAEPSARSRLGLATFAAMAVAVAACSDDTLARSRSDAGLGPRDGGTGGELPLQPGMTFQYRATLQQRETNGDEFDGTYTLSITIESVDDRGATASTLAFVATDATEPTAPSTWTPVRDFDSWVGRLGPSLSEDVVAPTPVTVELSAAPEAPPATTQATGKALPKPGPFFIDARAIEAISQAFLEANAARRPSFIDPAQNGGQWRLAFSGEDTSIFYYPQRAKTRSIELHYDPRGFLTRLEERIGDTASPPSGSCRLELIQGP